MTSGGAAFDIINSYKQTSDEGLTSARGTTDSLGDVVLTPGMSPGWLSPFDGFGIRSKT
jgi:hypothetical protein